MTKLQAVACWVIAVLSLTLMFSVLILGALEAAPNYVATVACMINGTQMTCADSNTNSKLLECFRDPIIRDRFVCRRV